MEVSITLCIYRSFASHDYGYYFICGHLTFIGIKEISFCVTSVTGWILIHCCVELAAHFVVDTLSSLIQWTSHFLGSNPLTLVSVTMLISTLCLGVMHIH
jgi:hypothetical protein